MSIISLVRWTFNRTLWNWNIIALRKAQSLQKLSIVPYGIETTLTKAAWYILFWLSIVPYGIETESVDWFLYRTVPFQSYLMELKLSSIPHVPLILLTFNRTLWNWNRLGGLIEYQIKNFQSYLMELKLVHLHDGYQSCWAFNRTLWNWNFWWRYTVGWLRAFNRTLWNWNLDDR